MTLESWNNLILSWQGPPVLGCRDLTFYPVNEGPRMLHQVLQLQPCNTLNSVPSCGSLGKPEVISPVTTIWSRVPSSRIHSLVNGQEPCKSSPTNCIFTLMSPLGQWLAWIIGLSFPYRILLVWRDDMVDTGYERRWKGCW